MCYRKGLRRGAGGVDQVRWKRWIAIPSWPCPACQNGTYRIVSKTIQVTESRAERLSQSDPSANHDDMLDRFVAHMKCDAPNCGETGTIAGNRNTFRFWVPDENDYRSEVSYEALSVIPSPLPFKIPPKVPRPIELKVREAATLFWTDQKAAASRVREAIEAILTDFGIPEHNDKGGPIWLDTRIKLFRELDDGKWAEQADLIEAAKWIGNLGTHDTVTRDEALDAFEMLETVIEDVFVRARHKVLAKARERNDKHRKPKATA